MLRAASLLARHPDRTDAAQDLVRAASVTESVNPRLHYDIGRLLACFSSEPLSDLSRLCYETAARLDPRDAAVRTALADLILAGGDVAGALQAYSTASQSDEGNAGALFGMIRCKIVRGQLDDAEHELDFLGEIQMQNEESVVDLLALKATLARRRGAVHDAGELFGRALRQHAAALADAQLTPEYLISSRSDLILSVVDELLICTGSSPRQDADPPRPLLAIAVNALRLLTRIFPGRISAHLLLAKTLFLDGRHSDAEDALAQSPERGAAHALLRARLHLERGAFPEAADALTDSVALDFNVQHTPLYHLLKSAILDARGQHADALSVAQSAMNLPGVRHRAARGVLVTDADRVGLFLLGAKIHAGQRLIPEATKLLQDARNEFEGTCEYDRVLIADAELASTARGDAEGALRLLGKVTATSPYYARARVAVADIHLRQRGNRRDYLRCFQELCEPATLPALTLLADAHLRIQEPAAAVAVFEQAMALAASTQQRLDPGVYVKIGVALVTCHDYPKAIAFYEKTISAANSDDPQALALSVDLARLLANLQQLDRAAAVVNKALANCNVAQETSAVLTMDRVRAHLLLHEIRYRQGDADAVTTLQQAYTLQKRVLDLHKMAGSGNIDQQRQATAAIACQIAETMRKTSPATAADFYAEAIGICPGHDQALLGLAQIKLASGDVPDAARHLDALLAVHPGQVRAQLALAEIKFKLNEHESAANYFKAILEGNPADAHALDRLLQCLRRGGQLPEIHRYLQATKSADPAHPGIAFIQGMVDLYERKPRDALRNLNLARTDAVWGRRALAEMVAIYLNADFQELIASSIEERIGSATQLLGELEAKTDDDDDDGRRRVRVLRAHATIASKDAGRIGEVPGDLMPLVQADRDYVPAYLAMASAFLEQGETTKARNQLKFISNMTPNSKFADEFEKSWLMLADLYIASGSLDLAQKLCRRTLEHSRSSARAWELLGEILTQEKAPGEAAQYFENAWQCDRETSSALGYKLAFSYLSAQRYIDAIDIAHKILAKNPDCTPLKNDVIDKCRACLRL